MNTQIRFRTATMSLAVSRRVLGVFGVVLLSAAWVVAFWPSAARPQPAGAATTTVTIGETNGGGAIGVQQYNSAAITISEGDTVTWNSAADAKFHDITSFEESAPDVAVWNSPNLKSGTANSSFSHTFSASGTFTYFCSLHAARADADPTVVDANIAAGMMVGKVTVQAPDTATPSNTPTITNTPPPGSTATNTAEPTLTPTQTNTPVPSPTTPPSATPTLSPTPLPDTVTVQMKNYLFEPAALTVRVGDTVRWVNNSGTPHTSTSSGNWDSSIVANGGSFDKTFNTAGTYNYKCEIHPDVQTGTITVVQDGSSPTAVTSAVASPTVPAAAATAPAAAEESANIEAASAGGAAAGPRAVSRAPMTVDVSMQDFKFSPNATTIAVGDTIRWTNKGNAPHNTTADSGVWASKQLMNSGESYTFTFKSAGSYSYKCTLHAGQGQTGTIIVKAVAEGTLLPDAGDGAGSSDHMLRTLLALALGLAGLCAMSGSLWARRAS
ncbi:MAG: cupredoxin domain-containing protein [Chloroflexi bacterium]|nr:cupredoxin domain-containing protein [Chloroflexota bacterium]